MNIAIVITSINHPTEAVEKFAQIKGHDLVVVGDKKTPGDWAVAGATFLKADDGRCAQFTMAENLPYNHYCRKMLGYLYAIKNGARAIIDTDDDNIPKDGWSFPELDGLYDYIEDDKGFINVYKLFTDEHIWPRGLPLSLINTNADLLIKDVRQTKIGVWQGLADEDPDVDAIYRLTSNKPCYFNSRPPVCIGKNTITPFNSQNTLIRKELFALLYLPCYVTFRFTDILRGLVAQPIMWLYDYHLGFVDATVIQKRNQHDFYKDFLSEIPMYQHTDTVINVVKASIFADLTIEENLLNAYLALKEHDIVDDREIETLKLWLKDLAISTPGA